jgi:hypothetical protein
MTHDYKRHGTTTLFAALSVLDGTVIGRCMQRRIPLRSLQQAVPWSNQIVPRSRFSDDVRTP